MQRTQTSPGLQNSEADAYQVARLVAEKCLSANRIADELFPEEYRNARTKARAIMRVKYLLRRAVATGILSIKPPRSGLVDALNACPEFRDVRFDVVSDVGYGLDPAEPVYREAARLVADRIHELLGAQERVVVANAGGWGLSRLAEYLPAVALNFENANSRLLFVALNALGGASNYQLSANYVAVRMASIYGGQHRAVVHPPHVDARYRALIDGVDLLLCGAGSSRAFLNQWLVNERGGKARRGTQPAVALPTGAIGDVCLIPIDEAGTEVPLPPVMGKRVREAICPMPSYAALRRLAMRNKVMLVAASPAVNGASADPMAHLKLPVVRAVLRAPLARWCVMGTSLARQLLEMTASRGQPEA